VLVGLIVLLLFVIFRLGSQNSNPPRVESRQQHDAQKKAPKPQAQHKPQIQKPKLSSAQPTKPQQLKEPVRVSKSVAEAEADDTKAVLEFLKGKDVQSKPAEEKSAAPAKPKKKAQQKLVEEEETSSSGGENEFVTVTKKAKRTNNKSDDFDKPDSQARGRRPSGKPFYKDEAPAPQGSDGGERKGPRKNRNVRNEESDVSPSESRDAGAATVDQTGGAGERRDRSRRQVSRDSEAGAGAEESSALAEGAAPPRKPREPREQREPRPPAGPPTFSNHYEQASVDDILDNMTSFYRENPGERKQRQHNNSNSNNPKPVPDASSVAASASSGSSSAPSGAGTATTPVVVPAAAAPATNGTEDKKHAEKSPSEKKERTPKKDKPAASPSGKGTEDRADSSNGNGVVADDASKSGSPAASPSKQKAKPKPKKAEE